MNNYNMADRHTVSAAIEGASDAYELMSDVNPQPVSDEWVAADLYRIMAKAAKDASPHALLAAIADLLHNEGGQPRASDPCVGELLDFAAWLDGERK